jgi:hypothetical protein
MAIYSIPASDGRARELVPDVERYENTFPKSSLLFFHIGHSAPDVGDEDGSGSPMCRTMGDGHRQLGPKILRWLVLVLHSLVVASCLPLPSLVPKWRLLDHCPKAILLSLLRDFLQWVEDQDPFQRSGLELLEFQLPILS